jgi:CTLH/CRA C-terminal to LisH motif domain
VARTDAFEGKFNEINEAIVMHLIREGQFEIVEALCAESHLPLPLEKKQQFQELYRILGAFRKRDLTPAIQWATTNREALQKKASNLEFQLHRIEFINILTTQPSADGQNDVQMEEKHPSGGGLVGEVPTITTDKVFQAITYAKKNFSVFGEKYIQGTVFTR